MSFSRHLKVVVPNLRQNGIGRMGRLEWDSQNRKSRTGQPGQETARAGSPTQDRQDRTTRIGLPGQEGRPKQQKQNSLDRTSRKGQP
jgi:hypothetical protein